MPTAVRDPITITMGEAEEACMDIIRAKLVPFLMSPPGIGKSDLAHQIAEKLDLFVIDIRLSSYDPADLNGFPFILDKDTQRPKAGYLPLDTFPIEGEPLPLKYKTVKNEETGKMEKVVVGRYRGWMILLDEFNSAPLSVQAASYKLILDKMVGKYRLHKRVVMMAAGNRMIDKAITNRIGTAMQSRVITLLLRVCNDAWMAWASRNNVDHRIRTFIEREPGLLHKFDPDHEELTFACPRTWYFLSRIIAPWEKVTLRKLAVMAGTVGEGAARQFLAYNEVYGRMPDIKEILADPEGVQFDSDPGIHYALTGLVSHHLNSKTADKLIKFLRRLDIDFQVVAIQHALGQDREIRKTSKEYKKWIAVHADELM